MPFLIYGFSGDYEQTETHFALLTMTKDEADAALAACMEAVADVRNYHDKGGYDADCKGTKPNSPEREAVLAKSSGLYEEAKQKLIQLGASPDSDAYLCDSFYIAEVEFFAPKPINKP